MTTSPSTLFVVYEPVSEHGGMIAPFMTEEFATDFYKELIADSLANLNVGLFVARLDDLTEEQATAILSNDTTIAKPILESEFDGYTITTLASFEATYDSWSTASLTVGNADFDASGEAYRVTI
jgi:hypothetical protein